MLNILAVYLFPYLHKFIQILLSYPCLLFPREKIYCPFAVPLRRQRLAEKNAEAKNSDTKLSLPKIGGSSQSSGPSSFRSKGSRRPKQKQEKEQKQEENDGPIPSVSSLSLNDYDPKKPLTVELQVQF